jgi:hypothetical protein
VPDGGRNLLRNQHQIRTGQGSRFRRRGPARDGRPTWQYRTQPAAGCFHPLSVPEPGTQLEIGYRVAGLNPPGFPAPSPFIRACVGLQSLWFP